MKIILVGLPGCGKTTVGRQLARRLQLEFADSDQIIEERIGCPIREYFESHGEGAFRDVEETVIAELTASSAGVLATGGGAVLRETNRSRLRAAGHVVYLRAPPEELYRRLRNDKNRPLLQVEDPQQRLIDLHAERDPLYRATAHQIVDASRPSVSALVKTVLAHLPTG